MRNPNSPTPVRDVILPASLAKGLSINSITSSCYFIGFPQVQKNKVLRISVPIKYKYYYVVVLTTGIENS